MRSRRAITSCSTRRRSRSVKLESRKTLDLIQFVDLGDIDPIYFDKPYYVVPADDLAEEAFVVLRDALKRSAEGRHRPAGDARPGICRQPEAVRPRHAAGDAALRRRGQQGDSYFRDIGDAKPDPDLLDLADNADREEERRLRRQEFHNRYVDALKDLIAEKQKKKGEKVIQDPDADATPPKGSNVIDLMAALKKSLGDDKQAAAKKPAARKAAAKPARGARRSRSEAASARKRA